MPRGGARVGAGRKPWKKQARIIAGGGDAATIPDSKSPSVGPVARPSLSPDVCAIWDSLAPKATEQGTLTPATSFEFKTLCELAVEQQRCLEAYMVEGFTDLGLRIGSHYRGLTQRLETKLRSFRLAPMGRELAAPASKDKPLTALEQLKQQRKNIHAVK